MVFERSERVDQQQIILGTIFLSIYRRHETPLKEMYEQLEQILGKIKDRYKEARIVIGGDFND